MAARSSARASRMRKRIYWAVAVAAGIVIAAAVVLPLISPTDGPVARRYSCSQNIRQLGRALIVYTVDSSGQLPPPDSFGDQDGWLDKVAPYLDDRRVQALAYCPADKMRCGRTSYRIPETAYGLNIEKLEHPEDTVILTEKCEFHNGRRWAYFADGHTELLPRTAKSRDRRARESPEHDR